LDLGGHLDLGILDQIAVHLREMLKICEEYIVEKGMGLSPDRRGKTETVKLVFFDESLRDTKTFEELPEDRCNFEASSLDKSWMDAKILYVILLGYI